jgi:hypothetical protein
MANMKDSNHYVSNKEFLRVLTEYKEACKKTTAAGKSKPPIPNYIGECFLKIAQGYSHKPNFINYTYREEMVSDGIENCLMYFENFDPSKSSNPFAYFTQIIHYAFLRRIDKEKKQMYVKYKSTEHIGIIEEFEIHDHDDGTKKQFELYHNISEFIQTYEDTRKKKKKVNKPKGLENFVEGE